MPSLSVSVTPTPVHQPKCSPDVILASNCIANFFYNIPRASLMVTLPGICILVIGAILVACTDRSQGWFEGEALVCLVFLVLGGAWTLGGIIFTMTVWCRNTPPSRSKASREAMASRVASEIAGGTDTPASGVRGGSGYGLELVSVRHSSQGSDVGQIPEVFLHPGEGNPSVAGSTQSVSPVGGTSRGGQEREERRTEDKMWEEEDEGKVNEEEEAEETESAADYLPTPAPPYPPTPTDTTPPTPTDTSPPSYFQVYTVK